MIFRFSHFLDIALPDVGTGQCILDTGREPVLWRCARCTQPWESQLKGFVHSKILDRCSTREIIAKQ